MIKSEGNFYHGNHSLHQNTDTTVTVATVKDKSEDNRGWYRVTAVFVVAFSKMTVTMVHFL